MAFPSILLLTLMAGCAVALEKNLQFPFDLPKGYGPWVHPTAGQVWPQPQMQDTSNDFMVLRPNIFQFEVILFFVCCCSTPTNFSYWFRSAGKDVIS